RRTPKAVPAPKGPIQAAAQASAKAAIKAPVKAAVIVAAKGKLAAVPAAKLTPEAQRQKLLAEQVAKLAANRALALASKGKNGKHKNRAMAEAMPVLSAADVEARRTRLKNLIVLGKERGYLTYAEINDHLPDDV